METLELKDIEPIKLEEIQKVESPSKFEAILRGAAQGSTLGFSDELTGALESAAGSVGLVPDKTYQQARDEARAANKAAQESHPGYYTGGEVAGGLATAVVPGLGASTVGKAALTGGVLGGLSGVGSSEVQSGSELASELAKGAGLGAVVGGGLGAVGKGLSKASEAYKGSALRKLVQQGEDISEKTLPGALKEEAAKDISKTLASSKEQLINIRDEIAAQGSRVGKSIPTPQYNKTRLQELIDSKEAGIIDDSLKSLAKKLDKPSLSPEELISLNRQVNELQGLAAQKNIGAAKPFLAELNAEVKASLPKELTEANLIYSKLGSEALEPTVLGGKKMSSLGGKLQSEAESGVSSLIEKLKTNDPEAIRTLEKLKTGLQSTEEVVPGFLGTAPEELTKRISSTAKEVGALEKYQAPFSVNPLDILKLKYSPFTGAAKIGLTNELGAKAVGMAAKAEKSIQDGMAKLRTAPDSELFGLADKLMSNEKTKAIGSYLQKALQDGDLVKRNAAIFSTLQNPQARLMVMPAKQEE